VELVDPALITFLTFDDLPPACAWHFLSMAEDSGERAVLKLVYFRVVVFLDLVGMLFFGDSTHLDAFAVEKIGWPRGLGFVER